MLRVIIKCSQKPLSGHPLSTDALFVPRVVLVSEIRLYIVSFWLFSYLFEK